MDIKFNILKPNIDLFEKYKEAFDEVISSGYYVLGHNVKLLEKNMSNLLGSRFVSCANGHDSLMMALILSGIKPGDKVLTTPLTAFATVLAILNLGAVPVFTDIDWKTGNMSLDAIDSVLEDVNAVIYVHLYGYLSKDILRLKSKCDERKIVLIEDCAQCHFAELNGKKSGTFGDFGCFSFYPTKNLGALGDAGGLSVNKEKADFEEAQKLRNYGQSQRYIHQTVGLNSRCDELQAALLNCRLEFCKYEFDKRASISEQYDSCIKNVNVEVLQTEKSNSRHSNHLYVIKVNDRDAFIRHMDKNNIEVQMHYPHLSSEQAAIKKYLPNYRPTPTPIAKAFSAKCVSLPNHLNLTYEDMDYICGVINEF